MNDDLPQGWTSTPLSKIAEINPRHPKGLDDAMPVTFVPMAGLNESKAEFKFTEERLLGQVRKGFMHFAPRDVLFAKITPCMENGKGAVARGLKNELGCGTTELHVVRPLAEINSDYIYRFLAQRSVRRAAKENFTGTAGQARVPTSFIEELEIPLPPLAEQMRIVAKLEKLLSRVDAAQARLATIPRILKRFRQSVLAAACSGKLTADWREANQDVKAVPLLFEMVDANGDNEFPDTWAVVRVGEIINGLKYGTSQKCSYDRRGVPVLRIPNIGDGVIETTHLKYAQLPRRQFEQLKLSAGDILLIRSNGSVSLVGKSALVRESESDFAYAGYLIRLKPNPSYVEPEFLNLALSSHNVSFANRDACTLNKWSQ